MIYFLIPYLFWTSCCPMSLLNYVFHSGICRIIFSQQAGRDFFPPIVFFFAVLSGIMSSFELFCYILTSALFKFETVNLADKSFEISFPFLFSPPLPSPSLSSFLSFLSLLLPFPFLLPLVSLSLPLFSLILLYFSFQI